MSTEGILPIYVRLPLSKCLVIPTRYVFGTDTPTHYYTTNFFNRSYCKLITSALFYTSHKSLSIDTSCVQIQTATTAVYYCLMI